MDARIDQETIDYIALRRLQNSYADIVTRRAWPELARIFVPDIEVVIDRRNVAPLVLQRTGRRRRLHPGGDRALRSLRVRDPQYRDRDRGRYGARPACTCGRCGTIRRRGAAMRSGSTRTSTGRSTGAGGSRAGGTRRSRGRRSRIIRCIRCRGSETAAARAGRREYSPRLARAC